MALGPELRGELGVECSQRVMRRHERVAGSGMDGERARPCPFPAASPRARARLRVRRSRRSRPCDRAPALAASTSRAPCRPAESRRSATTALILSGRPAASRNASIPPMQNPTTPMPVAGGRFVVGEIVDGAAHVPRRRGRRACSVISCAALSISVVLGQLAVEEVGRQRDESGRCRGDRPSP